MVSIFSATDSVLGKEGNGRGKRKEKGEGKREIIEEN